MSVIKEQYESLAPKGVFLSDIVVLAQAWKKSHTYIRRHNWYADVLELDCSTIDLERRLIEWANDVRQSTFVPFELLLVPAPKNKRWQFRQRPDFSSITDFLNINMDDLGSEPSFDDWTPNFDPASPQDDMSNTAQKLRPLAHVSIRDQTLATAVMMCLAEVVESAQGDSSEKDVLKAREAGVVSYGNRLHCRWVEGPDRAKRAHFSWGNSRTYRQYFDDYRNFLARPRRVCAELSSRTNGRKELFVVSLDITSFFDCIDRRALWGELYRLETTAALQQKLNARSTSDVEFWETASRIFNWRWRDSDNAAAVLIHGNDAETLKLGLPQGLVASGFFANAYLLGFDETLRNLCAKAFEVADGIKVLDYCRYVDDLRIVVEAPSSFDSARSELTLQFIKDFVGRLLRDHCIRISAAEPLILSETKCTITPYRSISAQSNVSTLMGVLNAELSGTFDLESLAQTAGGLEGLLLLSDEIQDPGPPKLSRLALANIAVPNTDVRDDTVKRFVATRLAQLMRHRLAMTDGLESSGTDSVLTDEVSSGQALSHEFEQTARKLIKCWAENPSLALLLRCGLDLFPHPKLLAPVVEALTAKLLATRQFLSAEQIKQVKTAEYVAADLLRAGAVETGFREKDEYPVSVDILGYREDLGSFARKVLAEYPDPPWYLVQQARLYLSSVGDLSHPVSGETTVEVEGYALLQKAMLYQPAQSEMLLQTLPYAFVAQQLLPNPRRFGVWLTECLRTTSSEDEQARAVMTVAMNRPDLIIHALTSRAVKTTGWKKFVPFSLIESSKKERIRSKTNSDERMLLHCMLDDENAFGQENALLVLARALLLVTNIEDRLANGLSAEDITVICKDWSRIQSVPESIDYLTVRLHDTTGAPNPLYVTPQWVAPEKAWLYGLGRILRAALTGEFDFTSRRYLVTEEGGRYAGLRSTWFKRRFGMLNSGLGLLDEPTPVSPWLSSLFSTLLQWPGVEFKGNGAAKAAAANSPADLLALVERRMQEQRALYGARCRTPIYVLPVADEDVPLQDRALRIAVVQPLRPRQSDFDVKDPTHWTPRVLKEHRRHVAEVCRLAQQQLRAWSSAQPPSDEGDMKPVVDVVLFPELAVHPEHVGLLRRLSDKLRANIFTGLTFVHSAKAGGTVNQGLWLLRSETPNGRSIQYVWQGKKHPMKLERMMGVKSYRPHVTLVELPVGAQSPTRIAAAICYDATDLDLVADLRNKSDIFLVAALNQDVQTFDNMVAALHFHMYQPVILANSGEFGGSTAQVPLPKHERLLSHVHGNNQIAVSVFEVDPAPFKTTAMPKAVKELKSPPAGYMGRPA